MYEDGAGFAATPIWRRPDAAAIPLDDEAMVESAVALVGILAQHATEHAATAGDCVMQFSIVPPPNRQSLLTHMRQFDGAIPQQFNNTRTLVTLPVSRRTVNLGDCLTPTGRLVVARMLMTDVFQAFGYPEVPQITEDGSIRKPYYARRDFPRVEEFAKESGITVIDSVLEKEP